MGKVLAMFLAVAQINLHVDVRVGIAFPQFVIHDDRGVCAGKFENRSTSVHGVRLGYNVRISRWLDCIDVVHSIFVP